MKSSEEDIKEKFPSICYSCALSRKVPDTNEEKGYVGCVMRLIPESRLGRGVEHLDWEEIQEGEEVGEGWIYSKRRPFSVSSGNTGEGIMANLQLITKGIKSCNQFENKS